MMKFIPLGPPAQEVCITNILHNQFYSGFHGRLQAHTKSFAKTCDSYNPCDLSLSNAVLLVAIPLKGSSLSVQLMKSQ